MAFSSQKIEKSSFQSTTDFWLRSIHLLQSEQRESKSRYPTKSGAKTPKTDYKWDKKRQKPSFSDKEQSEDKIDSTAKLTAYPSLLHPSLNAY